MMKPIKAFPISQWADVKATEAFVAFQTLSGHGLIRPEAGRAPTFVDRRADDRAIGEALLTALAGSRNIVPYTDPEFENPENYARAYEETREAIFRRTDKKTKREAYEDMGWCRVRRSEGKIRIRPAPPDGVGKWGALPEDMNVVIPATDDPVVVGAALRLAIERCTPSHGGQKSDSERVPRDSERRS